MNKKYENCIKIVFSGELYTINNVKSYKDVIKQMSERNSKIKENLTDLVLCGDGEYIFEPAVFNYFLLLFPTPKNHFHLRVNRKFLLNKTTTAFSPYPAAPVRRMNCFIGEYPKIKGTYNQRLELLQQMQQQQCTRNLQVNKNCSVTRGKAASSYIKRQQTIRCIRI